MVAPSAVHDLPVHFLEILNSIPKIKRMIYACAFVYIAHIWEYTYEYEHFEDVYGFLLTTSASLKSNECAFQELCKR